MINWKQGIYLEDVTGKEDELGSTKRKHSFVTSHFGRCTSSDQPLSAELHKDW
jgi:hypothetical protein